MDIQYVQHQNIDFQQWDHCIREAYNGNIYAYSWYLNSVCERWDALVEGNYERVFPLTYRKKYGIYYLYQPAFSQQLGIFSKTHLTPAMVDKFLDAVPGKFKLTEIMLNAYNEPAHHQYEVRMRTNLALDLVQTYDEIIRGYSQNLKRNLKNAAEKQWNEIHDYSIRKLIEIFRENRGKSITTLTEEDYGKLEELCNECKKRGNLILCGVTNENGNLCSGVIFFRSHQKIILIFSASNQEGRQHSAFPFIIDLVIRKFSETPLTLDFEGSEDPNLARFYKSFGATECNYPYIRRDYLPVLIRLMQKILS